MIILELTGGLGNQLFQYAVGRKLASLRSTALLFDIRYFRGDPTRSFSLGAFRTVGRPASGLELKLYCSRLAKLADSLLPHGLFHPTVTESPRGFDPTIFELGKRVRLSGYFSDNQYFEDNLSQLRKEFVLTKSAVGESYRELLSLLDKPEPSVAVHIRRGDYASNERNTRFFGILGSDYYERARNAVLARVDNPTFFIFTDDPQWVKEKRFFSKDANVHLISGRQGLLDYHEFDLMRRCDHQIIANSTFSWWAAALNPKLDKVVVQPASWFRDGGAQELYERRNILHIDSALRL